VHQPGRLFLSLSDVLATFSENSFVWVQLEFYGTHGLPDGMGMPEFENRVRSLPEGLPMNWVELKAFGNDVEQTFDCEITAFRANDTVATPH
jgi:hypothetical protein